MRILDGSHPLSTLLTVLINFSIMKMVEKNHAASIKVISLYVASTVVNILVKNPKTVSIGYKVC